MKKDMRNMSDLANVTIGHVGQMSEAVQNMIELYGIVGEGSIVSDEELEEREVVQLCQKPLKS